MTTCCPKGQGRPEVATVVHGSRQPARTLELTPAPFTVGYIGPPVEGNEVV
jgi:hypothetical protein